MKAAELREMDTDILEARLAESKAELFNLRFQFATGQFDRTHRFRELKREIARILTVLAERATAEVEEREAEAVAEGAERETWRQRLRRRRRARQEMLGQAEQVAAGHAGEGVEIVAPTPDEEPDEEPEEEPGAVDETEVEDSAEVGLDADAEVESDEESGDEPDEEPEEDER